MTNLQKCITFERRKKFGEFFFVDGFHNTWFQTYILVDEFLSCYVFSLLFEI